MPNTAALQYYGKCCCCLEHGEHRDVTIEYYRDEQPEIYKVLFKDTFDIVLKYPENRKLICEYCVVKLRHANHFKSMVESSQHRLTHRVNWQTVYDDELLTSGQSVKIERISLPSDTEIEAIEADMFVEKPQELRPTEELDIKSNSSCMMLVI